MTVGEDGRHEERDQESESGGAKNADFPLIPFHRKILFLMFHTTLITPNLKILKYLYTHVSGQTIATSHDLTPKGSSLAVWKG